MKILPLSIQLMHTKNFNNKKAVSNSIANYGLKKDTVSFGGSFIQNAYDNLEKTINSKIMPFVNENKGTYQALIDINNDISSIMKKVSSEEMDSTILKQSLATAEFDKNLQQYQPYIIRYNRYKTNLNNYARIKSLASDTIYQTPEMNEAVKNTENILFENNTELEKIKPLVNRYKKMEHSIFLFNEDRTIQSSSLPLKEKIADLTNKHVQAISYAMLMPLPETYMMLRSFKEMGKEVKQPSQSLMKTLTSIEHMQQSCDSIIKDMDRFNQNKQKIKAFINKYNKNKNNNPTDEEIRNMYDYIVDDCKTNARKEIRLLKDYYKENYLQKGINVDFKALDNYLNKCEDSVNTLQDIKKSIDRKYIEENNRKFFEQMGIESQY